MYIIVQKGVQNWRCTWRFWFSNFKTAVRSNKLILFLFDPFDVKKLEIENVRWSADFSDISVQFVTILIGGKIQRMGKHSPPLRALISCLSFYSYNLVYQSYVSYWYWNLFSINFFHYLRNTEVLTIGTTPLSKYLFLYCIPLKEFRTDTKW